MNLPKILHLYWGKNQPLSYFRYLTVISFVKYNPEWTVKLWTPSKVSSVASTWATGEQSVGYNGYDYMNELKDYIHEIDMSTIGIPDNIPEVHKSDLLRWYLLAYYGGIWSDFDILYIAPMPHDVIETWDGPGLCYYELPFNNIPNHKFHAIGFLASAGISGKQFFFELFKLGISKIPQVDYQAFGAPLIEKEHLPAWEASGHPFFFIDKNMVYPYTDGHRYFTTNELHIQNSIGLHWYGGHPEIGKHVSSITMDNIIEKSHEYSICKEALKII